jgi:hypothetical protein
MMVQRNLLKIWDLLKNKAYQYSISLYMKPTEQGELTVNWILGGRNKADMLTKALVGSKLVNAVGSVLEKGMILARESIGKYADSIGMYKRK